MIFVNTSCMQSSWWHDTDSSFEPFGHKTHNTHSNSVDKRSSCESCSFLLFILFCCIIRVSSQHSSILRNRIVMNISFWRYNNVVIDSPPFVRVVWKSIFSTTDRMVKYVQLNHGRCVWKLNWCFINNR